MTSQPIIACGFSGNVEHLIPHTAVEGALPEGIKNNKNAGCVISDDLEGEETRYTITLHRGDRVHINPCRPYSRYAGSTINLGSMGHALGARVHCWLTMDTDSRGLGMFRSLDDEGIRVNTIACGSTPITVGIRGDGATTLLMQKPASPEYSLPKEVIHHITTGIALCQPNIFFATSIGDIELACAQETFQRLPQALRIFCPRISILGKEEHERDLLKTMAAADVVFMNRREYRHLSNEEFDSDDQFSSKKHLIYIVNRLAEHITDKKQRIFVVTCDTDGASAVAHRAGNVEGIHDVPAVPNVAVVDTTGAGDAFALGMTIGLWRDIPWQNAMEWGARLAAENVKGAGGWFAADKKNNPHCISPSFFDPPTT